MIDQITTEGYEFLTDPNYFQPGAVYPPRDGMERQLGAFEKRRTLYNRGYLPGREDDPAVWVNWYRRYARFWADVLYAREPSITGPEQNAIDKVLQDVLRVARVVALDASIEGTGIYVFRPPDARLQAVNARHWFPIVAQNDRGVRLADVMAYPYLSGQERTKRLPDRLHVETYITGRVLVQTFALDGSTIGGMLAEAEYDSPPVAIIPVVHGDSGYHFGESDYPDMFPLVEENNRRLSGNSSVLDAFTDPHIGVPQGALTPNAAGDYELGEGSQVFPIPPGEEQPAYITWDAKLESNYTQLDAMRHALFLVTNISAAIFGDVRTGTIDSGAALRRLSLPTVQRLLVIRRHHALALQQVLATLAQQRGRGSTQPDAYEIEWPVPLAVSFDDPEAVSEQVDTAGGEAGGSSVDRDGS